MRILRRFFILFQIFCAIKKWLIPAQKKLPPEELYEFFSFADSLVSKLKERSLLFKTDHEKA